MSVSAHWRCGQSMKRKQNQFLGLPSFRDLSQSRVLFVSLFPICVRTGGTYLIRFLWCWKSNSFQLYRKVSGIEYSSKGNWYYNVAIGFILFLQKYICFGTSSTWFLGYLEKQETGVPVRGTRFSPRLETGHVGPACHAVWLTGLCASTILCRWQCLIAVLSCSGLLFPVAAP